MYLLDTDVALRLPTRVTAHIAPCSDSSMQRLPRPRGPLLRPARADRRQTRTMNAALQRQTSRSLRCALHLGPSRRADGARPFDNPVHAMAILDGVLHTPGCHGKCLVHATAAAVIQQLGCGARAARPIRISVRELCTRLDGASRRFLRRLIAPRRGAAANKKSPAQGGASGELAEQGVPIRSFVLTCPSRPCRPARMPPWLCSSSFGASAIITSVVSSRPATEAAFCSARRVTLVGSRMPSSSMSPNSPVAAL